MGIDVEAMLAAVAVIVAVAFAAHVLFRRLGIPDVIPLIGLGILLGPTGIVDTGLFRDAMPLVGTIAILVILFHGALEMRLPELRKNALSGVALAVGVLALTVGLCAAVARGTGMALDNALLLGLVLGGSGVLIVVPLIQRLARERGAVTTVTLEAALADAVVIVGVYVVATGMATGQADAGSMAWAVVQAVGLGVLGGLAAGFLWARALGSGVLRGQEYVLTLAALFATHVALEALHGSGPLGALVFGVVVGNSHRTTGFAKGNRLGRLPVFGKGARGMQEEVVFLVRAFFFVGLGVTLDLGALASRPVLGLGALLSLAIVLARVMGTFLVLPARLFALRDRFVVAGMFPRGLAAAALSQVPFQRFGLDGTAAFPAYAAAVIVLTNIAAAFLVFALARPSPPAAPGPS